MRRLWILVVVVIAALLIGVGYMVARGRPQWTSGSSEAIELFERCIESHKKFYFAEAEELCERALALDPDFAVARLVLAYDLRYSDEERAEELMTRLGQADLEPLTARERFLIRYHLSRWEGQPERASEILRDYLEDHPQDPYAMDHLCAEVWLRRAWDEAETCYQRLFETHPNWVEAQNRLGYIAMARGRFREAEDLFETYRFIAPDQANPHDSLGELLTLIGRYEDAERELSEALRTREDFCPSYEHLVRLYLLTGEFDRGAETVDRMEQQPSCRGESVEQLRCSIEAWRRWSTADLEGVWEIARPECLKSGDVWVMGHAAALQTGREEQAVELEKQLGEQLVERGEARIPEKEALAALLHHMKATRLFVAGEIAEAAEHYRQIDQELRYWNDAGLGIFKLFNRLALMRALDRLGQTAEAERVAEQIRSVNPRFLDRFHRDEIVGP